MGIAIISKSALNNCWSALQYTNNCHLCDKIFSCRVNSQFHKNGLFSKEKFEIEKIMQENKERLERLQNNIADTLHKLN